MSEIKTVKGGPIEYKRASQTPIARARRHINAAIAALEVAREKPGSNHLDLSHIITDLKAIEGSADGRTWAYAMSLARLEAQEEKP